ncbi:hypothetical protein D9M71_701270 [compost metagenome]
MIRAMKVPVAFQMMCQTTGISLHCTTPQSNASSAPPVALQPTPRPRGCQITRVMVSRKIKDAISMKYKPCKIVGHKRRILATDQGCRDEFLLQCPGNRLASSYS